MLGYTNLDSEKGFEFFQKFLKTNGILDELEKLGIEEGDTVKMYGGNLNLCDNYKATHICTNTLMQARLQISVFAQIYVARSATR